MQESGPTKIIPLTRSSAIWGQYPTFFHILSFLSAHCGKWLQSLAAQWQVFFFFFFLSSLSAHWLTLEAEITDDCDVLCLLIWQEAVISHKPLDKDAI